MRDAIVSATASSHAGVGPSHGWTAPNVWPVRGTTCAPTPSYRAKVTPRVFAQLSRSLTKIPTCPVVPEVIAAM